MRVPRLVITLVSVAALVAAGWFALRPTPAPNHDLTLTLKARSGANPLVFDEFVYANPGGDGFYRLRDFRFYLSNIRLLGSEGNFAEPDSYHLIRFDNPEKSHSITVTGVPLHSIKAVQFAIGVDAEANGSIEPKGDLDPNSQMAWNWEVGYKFVVFEGGLRNGDKVQPLVYHVGFTENLREVEFSIPDGLKLRKGSELGFDVDVAKLFDNTTRIDMEALRSVKFDREDARMLADNYSGMIMPAF